MSAAQLLELRDACVVRDGRTILSVDKFSIAEGEHLAVLGPNGAGKSTLIKLLTRDILPLWVDPPPVLFRGEARIPLLEARSLLGVVSADAQEQRALVALGELEVEHLAERMMSTLSTGEARRVLIARALVHDPAVLVLDEPCNGLDPHAAHNVRLAVSLLARGGRSLVLVTHHVEDIVPEIERVVMLQNARIVADGPKCELLTSERLGELFHIPVELEEREGHYRLW